MNKHSTESTKSSSMSSTAWLERVARSRSFAPTPNTPNPLPSPSIWSGLWGSTQPEALAKTKKLRAQCCALDTAVQPRQSQASRCKAPIPATKRPCCRASLSLAAGACTLAIDHGIALPPCLPPARDNIAPSSILLLFGLSWSLPAERRVLPQSPDRRGG